MLSKADDYPIHQTPDPIAFSGTDRNFYDRYFFNGYTPDGNVFFAASLGVYPHLNIMDAGFAVRIGDRQYNLHASRHLHMERMDTHVGPIRVEVVEPLQVLRVVVDDNEHGISADITIAGRHAPIEEPRSTRRIGPRIVQDVTRMTQLGHWSGWIKAGGQTVTLEAPTTLGTRDRSWGVRPVGARDPQGGGLAQFFWQWTPVNLPTRSVFYHLNAHADGSAWNTRAVIAPDGGTAQAFSEDHAPHMATGLADGTRWPAVAAGGALASLASLVAVLTWPAGPWQAGDAPERWALQTGTTVSDAALQRVLDTAASGSRLQTPQGMTSLVASFETTAGPCREIGRTTADGGQSELAVVCRTGSDRWQVVFAEAGASAGYVTASSQRQERADAVLEKLKARPLDDAAEQALLGSGWRR